MQTLLANRSPNVDHLAQRLLSVLSGNGGRAGEPLARELANILAELDHRLRVDVDEALGRLELRIESEIHDLGEAEQ